MYNKVNQMHFDKFASVLEFHQAISTRPNNGAKGLSDHSTSQDSGWAGMPYQDAENSMVTGLPEVTKQIKRELAQFTNTLGSRKASYTINYFNGYAPNVARAIQGHPMSMRKKVRHQIPAKTITLFYSPAVNCSYSSDDVNNAGLTTLKLVNLLESNGYKVKLVVIPFLGESQDNKKSDTKRYTCCGITLKDFSQPLDLLKLSFPVTSVAMFRRLGFKWLETIPGLDGDWNGYGRPLANDGKSHAMDGLKRAGYDVRNAHFIMVDDCKNADNNPFTLAKNLGIMDK